ncbi:probable GH family 25 lysozyme 5 isoform X2 [Oscarella lobularis]|uniref:probable GH family 25 lysozyme 5 isoform X2 n=1 Tax=Oscarella lobularis TaxID=121494 RepID=UPI00331359EE
MISSVIIFKVLFCHLAYSACVKRKGVDVSTIVSKSQFECLKKEGYSFAIVRAHRSTGELDESARGTLENAQAAGMSDVDVYLFPCYCCGNPAEQVSKTVNSLKNLHYRTLWLDIEDNRTSPNISEWYWPDSKEEHQEFFKTMFDTAKIHKDTGVYASKYYWEEIMGNDYEEGKSVPLWYPRYKNNDPSFDDFEKFGGWEEATIKQYHPNVMVCGVNVNENTKR